MTVIRIYINKKENRITFKLKTRDYLELLTPGTMKLLGSAKSKINKDKNSENMPHLEITELVSIHYNIANNNIYPQDSRNFYTFIPNISFGQLLDIFLKKDMFLKTCRTLKCRI